MASGKVTVQIGMNASRKKQTKMLSGYYLRDGKRIRGADCPSFYLSIILYFFFYTDHVSFGKIFIQRDLHTVKCKSEERELENSLSA